MVVKMKLGPGVLALTFKGLWTHTARDDHKVTVICF